MAREMRWVLVAITVAWAALAGCAARTTPPHIVVASYGADVLQAVGDVQQLMIDVSKAGGGRTPATDRVMVTIRDQVIPIARGMRDLLVTFDTLTDPASRAAKEVEIQQALALLEVTLEQALRREVDDGLPVALALTAIRTRQLIFTIRFALARS